MRKRALGANSAKGLVCGGVVDLGGGLNRQGKGVQRAYSDIGAVGFAVATACSGGFDRVLCGL